MPSKYIPVLVKREVDRAANGCCEYCKCLQKFTPESHEYEHIIPLTQGGTNRFENIAKACRGCNIIKSISIAAIDPITQKTVRLFHPRENEWDKHFDWSEDLSEIVGLTAIGRATVARLQSNRQTLINLRKITIDFGHPPL